MVLTTVVVNTISRGSVMDTLALLQQIGLNKYEAQAYLALVAGGPMTGYELGKRSDVPLSRSYEVLERLRQKGLALVQPGNVPRYVAEEPQRLMAHFQADFQSRMDTLSSLLISLASAASTSASREIWVVSGRQNVLARVATMVEEAQHHIALALPATYHSVVRQAVEGAKARGCDVVLRATSSTTTLTTLSTFTRSAPSLSSSADADVVLALADGRNALAGTISSSADPLDGSQAVVTSNEGLVLVVSNWLAPSRHQKDADITNAYADSIRAEDRVRAPEGVGPSVDWLAWEERKHRRLLALGTGGRVA